MKILHDSSPPSQHPTITVMPVIREIATLDMVELTEPVEGTPAGSRGGVLELRDGDVAMIETTSMQL
jgi:hypothetical protein